MIMNKQSSKSKSSIIPNVTEYLPLQNFLRTVPCNETLDNSVSKMQKDVLRKQ